MENPERERSSYQFSLRTMLLITAALALLLTPVAWVARERRQMMAAQGALLQAREAALRSVVREEQRRRDEAIARLENAAPAGSLELDEPDAPQKAASVLEQLLRENADLKLRIDQLQREVKRLERNQPRPAGPRRL